MPPDRRRFLSLAAVAPFAYLPARTRRMNVMDAAGEQAATMLADYYKADLAVTHKAAGDQLRQLDHPVTAATTHRGRAAGIRATARFRALYGQTLCDLGQLVAARTTLGHAHFDAVQIGDRELTAYIRGLQAKVEDQDLQYKRALRFLADGHRQAGPQLRVKLRAQTLGPLASLNRPGDFDEVLAYTRDLVNDTEMPDTAAPSFTGADRATVARHTLEGLARFGVGERREQARHWEHLRLLNAVDKAHLSGPACTMRLDLAAALMRAEPDHACALMRETVGIVAVFGVPAPTLVDRARRTLHGADRQIPVVRDTAELLRTTWQVAA